MTAVLPDPSEPLPSDAEIYEALKQCNGNLSDAAKELECRRTVLQRRINEVPILAETIQEYREEMVDRAEEQLDSLVRQGDPATVRFVASTIGKERGYSSSVVGSGKGGSIVIELKDFSERDA